MGRESDRQNSLSWNCLDVRGLCAWELWLFCVCWFVCVLGNFGCSVFVCLFVCLGTLVVLCLFVYCLSTAFLSSFFLSFFLSLFLS
jgi:hypothetical protein